MTQAPTPGPLSGDDVKLLVKGDLLRIDTGGALYEFVRRKASPSALIVAKPVKGGLEKFYDRCRFSFVERPSLAPPAPVEASGSERDTKGETFMGFRVAAWRYRQGDETYKLPHHYAEHWSTPGASAWGIQRLFTEDQLQQALNTRPQPSGEEQCAACSRGEVTHFSTDDGFWVEITTSAGGANEHGLNGWFETLEHYPDGSTRRREYVATDSPLALRPAPVASGGQHSSATNFPPDDVLACVPVAETAGEAVAWQRRIYSFAGKPSDWQECDPPEDPTNLRPAAIIEFRPLYAAPVPAQDDDKLRIAVEALDAAYRRWVVEAGESNDVLQCVGPVIAALKAEEK